MSTALLPPSSGDDDEVKYNRVTSDCSNASSFEFDRVISTVSNVSVESNETDNDVDLRMSFQTPSQILPNFYLGSEINARNFRFLTEKNIMFILSVHDSIKYPPKPFKLKHIPLSDAGDSSLEKILPKCFKFIDEAHAKGGKVLLHCKLGVNRSPTVTIAYLMRKEGWNLRRAYEWVKQKRPQISPHEKYLNQLRQYEVSIFGTQSYTDDTIPKSMQQYMREAREEDRLESMKIESEKEAASKVSASEIASLMVSASSEALGIPGVFVFATAPSTSTAPKPSTLQHNMLSSPIGSSRQSSTISVDTELSHDTSRTSVNPFEKTRGQLSVIGDDEDHDEPLCQLKTRNRRLSDSDSDSD